MKLTSKLYSTAIVISLLAVCLQQTASALTFDQIKQAQSLGQVLGAGTAPTTGLVGYWNLDEGSGTIANDFSGTGNFGTLINGPVWATGKYNTGLSFDGTTPAYVNLGNPASLSNLSTFTWTFWANIPSTATNISQPALTISSGSDVIKEVAFLPTNNSSPRQVKAIVKAGTTNAQSVTANNTYTPNVWQQWTITYNDSGDRMLHIYLNGTEVSYSNQTAAVGTEASESTYKWSLGATGGTQFYKFRGTLDEVRMYNRVLTSQEITDVYNDPGTPAGTTPPTNPPVISAVSSSAITQSSATITWTTDVPSDSQVEYGPTTSYGSSSALDSSQVTSHSVNLSGLTAATTYHYRVKSSSNGNLAVSADNTFTTTAPPPPSAPIITSFTASPGFVSNGGSATLTWNVTGATSVTIDNGLGTQSNLTNGSVAVSPPVTTTYTLTASNAQGSTNMGVTVSVSSPAPPAAGAPTLYFTDLTSGPNTGGENNNGAYVTIYGNNFGTSPTVTVGGGAVPIKLQPTTYFWYQKMVIQLGASARTGNIVVSNSFGNSNSLPFTVRAGNIYFVATNGSDNASGSFVSPWASIKKCKNTIAAGDTCYIENGINETTKDTTGYVQLNTSGTPGSPKAIVAYPGASVTVGQIDQSYNSGGYGSIMVYPGVNNWTLSGLHVIGAGDTAFWAGNSPDSYFRLVANKFECPAGGATSQNGCIGLSQMFHFEFLGNEITNAGCGSGATGGLDDGVGNSLQAWQVPCQSIAGAAGTTFSSSDGTHITLSTFHVVTVAVGDHLILNFSNGPEERVISQVNLSGGPANDSLVVTSPFSATTFSGVSWSWRPSVSSHYYHTLYNTTNTSWVEEAWNYIHNNSSGYGLNVHSSPLTLNVKISNIDTNTPVQLTIKPTNFKFVEGQEIAIPFASLSATQPSYAPCWSGASGKRWVHVIKQPTGTTSGTIALYTDVTLSQPLAGPATPCSDNGSGNNTAGQVFVDGLNQHDISMHDNWISHQNAGAISLSTVDPSDGPVLVYNNIIDSAGSGPYITGSLSYVGIFMPGYIDSAVPGSGDVMIYNNTIYNSGKPETPAYPNPVVGDHYAALLNQSGNQYFQDFTTRYNAQNNIIVQTGKEYFDNGANPSTPGAQWAGANNLLFGGTFTQTASAMNATLPASWTGTIQADPLFTNPSAGDFSLQAGSPAIGAGTDLGFGTTLGAHLGLLSTGSVTPPPSDTTPPSTPTGVTATAVSTSAINLTWAAATDNVGVTGYKIFRNNTQIGTSASASFADTGLTSATTYSYTVSAYDAAGNTSAPSTAASATTLSATDTTSPTASITSPTNGATVSGAITVSATASDPTVSGQTTSGLSLVTVSIDGGVFATSTSGTLSKSLDTTTLTNSSHTISVAAKDNAGNVSSASSVTVTVNNAAATKFPRLVTLTSLEGLTAIPAGTTITAQVISPANGAVLETESNLTATSGNYTIPFQNTDPQLVNIRITVPGYLSQLLTNIDTTVNSSLALSVPQLLAGDLNNDNTINSLDYSLMNSHFLQNFSSADINKDNLVNSLDFAILKNNYGKSGL